ncbi:CHAT domain-containing protein [Streptomyces erythrochromogenes]|uniref:CHAT domain-containing protein n=1 Tax=Streptomyces erythrochromogenes TaxID=285574 RepID=UPI0036A8DC19
MTNEMDRLQRARALMTVGIRTGSRADLIQARNEYLGILEAVQTAREPSPGVSREVALDLAYTRLHLSSYPEFAEEATEAHSALDVLLADPSELEGLSVDYLTEFGASYFRRGGDQGDGELLQKADQLLSRALEQWDVTVDGSRTRAAFCLTFVYALLHQIYPDSGYCRKVVATGESIRDAADLTEEERSHLQAQLAISRFHSFGTMATDAEQNALIELFERYETGIADGSFDYGQGNLLLLDTEESRQRWESQFARTFQFWEGLHHENPTKATTAAIILEMMYHIDPHEDRLGAAREQGLVAAVENGIAHIPDWAGKAHEVLGVWFLRKGIGRSRVDLMKSEEHFAAARSAGNNSPRVCYGAVQANRAYAQLVGAIAEQQGNPATEEEVGSRLPRSAHDDAVVRCHVIHDRAETALHRGDLRAADLAINELCEAIDGFPSSSPARMETWARWESVRLDRNALAGRLGEPKLPPPAGRPTIDEVRDVAAGLPRPRRAEVLGSMCQAWLDAAFAAGDHAEVRRVLVVLDQTRALLTRGSDPWIRCAFEVGGLYGLLAQSVTDPSSPARAADLAKALPALEEAFAALEGPEDRLWPAVAHALARAYRARDDRSGHWKRRGLRLGLDALSGYVWAAVLQSSAHDVAEAVRSATSVSREVTGWCIADGVPADALSALDACRGLALHAASSTRSISERLTAAGRSDLAESWQRADGGPEGVPARLRREALLALVGDDTRLMDPPSPADIAEALHGQDRDALVYLVPASPESPGVALVIAADGTVRTVPLPELHEDAEPLSSYAQGDSDGYNRDRDAVVVPSSQRGELNSLCLWAWRAAMEPLLTSLGSPQDHRPTRLVLIPMGALGLVPWHAAYVPVGSGRRYAMESAEISYAASARLFCEVSARPAVPFSGTALIVGDPGGDLRHAREEALAIREAFYPTGRCLGYLTDDGSPGEVADWLLNGSNAGALLHLACHGTVARTWHSSTYLTLAGGQLTAEEIVDSLAGQLGLVVLAACRTQVSGHGPDDAYSLAASFLVAGSRSAIGSLWLVPDEATSLLMFMTHYYLRHAQESPARALRRAQLWMLDPHRAVPACMPSNLKGRLDDLDPHDLSAWAGFTHLGQ